MKSKKLISLGIMAAMLTGMVLTGWGNNAGFIGSDRNNRINISRKYSSIR